MIRRPSPPLLAAIEAYMRHTRTTPSGFGRAAVGDPNFVTALRDGRRPRAATIRRVLAFIASEGRSA